MTSRPSPPRIVTATALFDGHDASINLIRRLLQAQGAEVIHLGHNRPAHEIVRAAVQEEAHAICVSSYQGGHNEFFPYLRKLLIDSGRPDMPLFGGGGGVILPREVAMLAEVARAKIFTPEDGRQLGLEGMVQEIISEAEIHRQESQDPQSLVLDRSQEAQLSHCLYQLEQGRVSIEDLKSVAPNNKALVLGVTGPGGAGKSSLVDELLLRFGRDSRSLPIAIISVDPTKRKTGGALLGDRLRMNAIYRDSVYLRSLATRESGTELSKAVQDSIEAFSKSGFSFVIVETAGTGQGAAAILEVADVSLYVMTPEFGAPTQLEKIDMLDFADWIALNKSDRQGAEDAVGQVIRQLRRTGVENPDERVIGTCAHHFNDSGVEQLYLKITERLQELGLESLKESKPSSVSIDFKVKGLIPPGRENYLWEAAHTVRKYKQQTFEYSNLLSKMDALATSKTVLEEEGSEEGAQRLREIQESLRSQLPPALLEELNRWEATYESFQGEKIVYQVRDRQFEVQTATESLSGTRIPKVALPKFENRSQLVKFLRLENLPGSFPYTAGVFPFRRRDENPTRQFAGEGPPEKTNRRFHLLCEGQPAKRLSTAFDSVTLYGHDPAERPDIWGKVGESGVSIATLDDMKRLYHGFDLCSPSTSVSMTINGPAPILLAMFFNTAIDQRLEAFVEAEGRSPDREEEIRLRTEALRSVRGTVQADILKEDQAQNTCIFSTPFALKMMGDVQEFFDQQKIKNFYSISISGYHIAEAGANPITQLAFTLANGLTYVEYFLSRGLNVDAFAPSLSFFFSMGLDPEYSVIGRVARRIWAIVLKDLYGASERAQKLKYHIQTSGRSLHAREVAFNDIRTTLQALMAYFDQCNSLHTNAYDEAVTTPTEESVRRALAIQLIVQKELGASQNENPNQGSYLFEELTDLVEEAVLDEFERISTRGGIPGAMETGYLRGKIQDESHVYESTKQTGERPIIGVNTFLNEEESEASIPAHQVVRSTPEEKDLQIERLRDFQKQNLDKAETELARLKEVASQGGNTFEVLMDTVKVASLGQISDALFEVGGAYRRMM